MVDSGKTFTRDEIRKNLSGHLCRCTGYQNIINGVEKAIEIVHEKVGELCHGHSVATALRRGRLPSTQVVMHYSRKKELCHGQEGDPGFAF